MQYLNMKHVLFIAITTITILAAGCASNPSPYTDPPPTTRPVSASAGAQQHAECLVCKKNADLACVDVDVDAKTPYSDYNGKRYYFCSDECKQKFMKNPAAYMGQ